MCGICGVIDYQKPIAQSTVRMMLDKLHHRGPDASKLVESGYAVLGHTRLKIIDLSDASAQPMSDNSGRYLMTFNGEIYNYIELRKELSGLGHEFKTQGDGEVLLAAFVQWQEHCLKRLNGMFAFAVWDTVESSLFLARDRIGEKPLFFMENDGTLSFASEMQALLSITRNRHIDPQSFTRYLLCNYTTGRKTLYKHIQRLMPGHYIKVTRHGIETPKQYWSLVTAFHSKTFMTFSSAAEYLQHLLDNSVSMRTVGDVPVGCLLSGGLDSSSILASLLESGHLDVDSFSTGFVHKSYNELEHAQEVAGHFASRLHTHTMQHEPEELINILDWIACEPLADTSCIPMYQLCEFARQRVTVCLGGDGADELFAGYPTYLADQLSRPLRILPKELLRVIYRFADSFLPNSYEKLSFDYKVRQFLKNASLDRFKAHVAWRSIFDSEELKKILTPQLLSQLDIDTLFDDFMPSEDEAEGLSLLDLGLLIDCRTWLPDNILVKSDRASMAHGLELRAPFLDHRIIEFAAGLPPDFKMRQFNRKRILKASQSSRLPVKTLKRKKQGFNAPFSYWLLTQYGSTIKKQIQQSNIGCWVQFQIVETLFDDHFRGKKDNSLRILSLFTLSKHMSNST